jgi:hypothetical protein
MPVTKFVQMLETQRQNPETARAGLKWDQEEIDNLLDHIRNDVPIEDIAKELQRTAGSIKTRLITYALNEMKSRTLEEVAEELRLNPKDITEYERKKSIREQKRSKAKTTKQAPQNTSGKVSLEMIYSLLQEVKSELSKVTGSS